MSNSNPQPIGKVSIVPRDVWSSSQQYYRLDLVTYEGGSYLAKSDNKNITPTNTNTWLKIAEKGNKGDTGDPAATADVEAWLEDNVTPISSVLTLPNWSNAETYAVNNVVLYTTNNKVYRCHTAVETAGTLPTNTDYWSEVVVASIIDNSLSITGEAADAKATGDEISELKSTLTASTKNAEIVFTPGGYIKTNVDTGIDVTSVTENANYRYAVVECSPGEEFTINVKGAATGRAWAFVKQNGDLIQNSTASITITDKILTAPVDAKWLVLNDNNTEKTSYYGRLFKTEYNALLRNQRLLDISWEMGGLNSGTGNENDLATNRIRTNYIKVSSGDDIYINFNPYVDKLYIFGFTDCEVHDYIGTIVELSESGIYTVPSGITYLRFSTGTIASGTITPNYAKNVYIAYMDDVATGVLMANIKTKSVPLTFTSGYYMTVDGAYQTTGDWCYSGHIPCKNGEYLIVKNGYAVDFRLLFFYDSSDNVIGLYDAVPKNAYIAKAVIKVPQGASYCIVNAKDSTSSTVTVNIIQSKIELNNDCAIKAIHASANVTGHKLNCLFDKIKAVGPLFTIVDDDGRNLAQITNFHSVCMANNVVGCNALATKFIDDMSSGDKETFLATLRQYEQDGFENVMHCYNHDYWESSIKSTMTNAELFAAVTNDIAIGIRDMESYGFHNWRQWIVPQGKTELPNVERVARNLNITAAYDVANNNYNRFAPRGNTFHRFNIPRMELYPNDTVNPGHTLQSIKDMADICAEEKGWLIVCTHFYQAGWGTDDPTYNRVSEMIQYIMNLGFVNVTLSGGMSYWEDIYRMYGLY